MQSILKYQAHDKHMTAGTEVVKSIWHHVISTEVNHSGILSKFAKSAN